MTLPLDRMALDDAGFEPGRIAGAILAQLGYQGGRVSVDVIALALDIEEIRLESLNNFEGALLTTSSRSHGSILVNSKGNPQRQRFTIGHELGHFLIPSHTGPAEGFYCSRSDMGISSARTHDRRAHQELEANRFAIEILAPRVEACKFADADPDIARILAMATTFDISRAAAARRFVELSPAAVAIVFSKDGRLAYTARSQAFPAIAVRGSDALFLESQGSYTTADIPANDADPSFWLVRPPAVCALTVQTLFQKGGYALSLLHLDAPDEDVESGLEDAFDRFTRFNAR
jgi:Zn-dependent peptidase ImmA (M78 family)